MMEEEVLHHYQPQHILSEDIEKKKKKAIFSAKHLHKLA